MSVEDRRDLSYKDEAGHKLADQRLRDTGSNTSPVGEGMREAVRRPHKS